MLGFSHTALDPDTGGATVKLRQATKRLLEVTQCRNVVAQNPGLAAAARIAEVQDTPELARRVAPEIARRILPVERRARADRRSKSTGEFDDKAEDAAYANSARYNS
jgi:hypothetical protein